MSEEQLKAFAEAVKVDNALRVQLKAADNVDAVVAIAKAVGFTISVDEMQKFADAGRELTDEELKGVAGGFLPFFICMILFEEDLGL